MSTHASRKLKTMPTFHIVKIMTVKQSAFQVERHSALLQYFNHSRN